MTFANAEVFVPVTLAVLLMFVVAVLCAYYDGREL